jgi:hypothetical protein
VAVSYWALTYKRFGEFRAELDHKKGSGENRAK